MNTNLSIEKIKEKIWYYKDKLYKAQCEEHEKINNIPWGSGFNKRGRTRLTISTSKSDYYENKIKEYETLLKSKLPPEPEKKRPIVIMPIKNFNNIINKMFLDLMDYGIQYEDICNALENSIEVRVQEKYIIDINYLKKIRKSFYFMIKCLNPLK